MSKKLMIIIINFIVVLIVTFLLINKIKVYQGLEDVYVAKTMIRKGQQITNDMLTLRQVTLNREGITSKRVSYYDDVITPKNLKECIGEYAAYDIIPDEIIVKAKLLDKADSNGNYMYNLPDGYYVYVIPNTLTGGIIKVNDLIDLYIYDEDQQTMVNEPLLRHLRAYDLRDKDNKSINVNDENGEPQIAKYIVLALNHEQLNKLMYYQNKGATIRIALRNRSSERFNYPETKYPEYEITSEGGLVDENKEKQILEQIKQLNAKKDEENQNTKSVDANQEGGQTEQQVDETNAQPQDTEQTQAPVTQ